MINKVTLMGNVGKDPEIRNGSYGSMATFSVATTESWKDKRTGEWMDKTEWHNVSAFGYAADAAERLNKGDLVYLEGSIQTTKKDDRYYTNIKAKFIRNLGRRERNNSYDNRSAGDSDHGDTFPDSGTGEEVPF